MYTFPDPIEATCGILSDAVGLRTSNHRPDQHDPEDDPVVQVNVDGDDVIYPILTEPTIRITAWSKDAGQSYDLAQQCQAVLLSHNGSQIVGYRSNGGPVPGADPNNGDQFATFTVTGRIRST
jgi:hypothetical protein